MKGYVSRDALIDVHNGNHGVQRFSQPQLMIGSNWPISGSLSHLTLCKFVRFYDTKFQGQRYRSFRRIHA